MDFLIDENLYKIMKPVIIGLLGIATIFAINYGLQSIEGDNSEDQGNDQEQNLDNKARKPAGIFNQGNTCFVNSLLQALGSLNSFINNMDYLIEKCDNRFTYDERLLVQLRNALKKINDGSENVDIMSFLQLLSEKSDLINFEQQDAHELYSTLVSSFEQVNNNQKRVSLSKSTLSAYLPESEQEEICDNQSRIQKNISEGQNNSLQGYTKSSITCSGCKSQKNIKIHPFYNISFDIAHPSIRTIDNAFQKYQEKQVITGWNCLKCSITQHIIKLQKVSLQLQTKCNSLKQKNDSIEQSFIEQTQILIRVGEDIIKYCEGHINDDDLQIEQLNFKLADFITKYKEEYEKVKQHPQRDYIFMEIEEIKRTIFKQTVITKFPSIFVVHLKQLSINPFTGEPILLKKFIDFPQEWKIPVRNGEKTYRLTSLLSHVGNQSMGHYYTYRKLSGAQKQWYLISDTFTKHCRWESLRSGLPYMLFYEIQQQKKVQP